MRLVRASSLKAESKDSTIGVIVEDLEVLSKPLGFLVAWGKVAEKTLQRNIRRTLGAIHSPKWAQLGDRNYWVLPPVKNK